MPVIPGKRLLLACGRFLVKPATCYVAAWIAALVVTGLMLHHSWTFFDAPPRPDKNCGHVFIDFAGQYVMGRMAVEGHAHELYNRRIQREVVERCYPRKDEAPLNEHTKEEREGHDDENLMFWFLGEDDPAAAARIGSVAAPLAARQPLGFISLTACAASQWQPSELKKAFFSRGGPLYPPVTAFLCYPLALLRPQPAYRLMQIMTVLLTVVSALGVGVISRGRIWWPVALAAIVLFPGYDGNLNLGQNAVLTLTILIWGWALVSRGRPVAGGAVWGLLVFKPVWAAAFFLVPVLTRRWRMALAMIGVGAALAAATLPLVGWQTWYDWLKIGQEAADTYLYDKNWILLSRDALTLPRKLLDFQLPAAERRNNLAVLLAGWAIVLFVLEITVRLALFRKKEVRKPTGPGPALIMLAAWVSCYHFMYYDVLLGFLPVALLFTEPRRYLELYALAIVPLFKRGGAKIVPEHLRRATPTRYPATISLRRIGPSNVWMLNRVAPTAIVVMRVLYDYSSLSGTPVDTYCLLAFWTWCAWLVGIRWDSRARRLQRRRAPATLRLEKEEAAVGQLQMEGERTS
jgi:hypothetical protein